MRTMILAAALALAFPAALALAAPAAAATPEAWAAGRAAAAAACIKASGLRGAAVAAKPVGFSDANPVDVLLVTGTWRPKRLKGTAATMLCLYDRAAKTAETQEAPGWLAAK